MLRSASGGDDAAPYQQFSSAMSMGLGNANNGNNNSGSSNDMHQTYQDGGSNNSNDGYVFETGQRKRPFPGANQQISLERLSNLAELSSMHLTDLRNGTNLGADQGRSSNLSNSGLVLPRLSLSQPMPADGTRSPSLSNLSSFGGNAPRGSGLSFLLGQTSNNNNHNSNGHNHNISGSAQQQSDNSFMTGGARFTNSSSESNTNDRFLRFTGLGMGLDRPSNLSQGIGRFTSHLLLDPSARPSNLAEQINRLSNLGFPTGSSFSQPMGGTGTSTSSSAGPSVPFVTGRPASNIGARQPPVPSAIPQGNDRNIIGNGNNNNNNNNNNNTYFTGVGSLGGRGNFGQLSAGNGGSNKSSTYGASSPTESVRTSGLSVGRDYNDGSYGDVKQSIPAGASARNGNNAGNDHTEAGYKISGAPSSKPFHTVSQGNGGAANNNNNNNNKTAIQVKTEEKERDDHLDRDSKSPSASSPAAVSRAELSAGLHSLELFLRFVKEYPDPEMPSRTIIDTSQILSSECYEAWIATRRGSLKKPEESFRRALTAHVTGADRRRPFPPHVEASLLIELRKQKTWPCFEGRMSQNENKPIKIGEQGFRTHGYHERKASEAKDSQQRADRNISPSNFSSSPLQANNMSAPVHPVPLMLNGRANPGHGHQQPFATGQQSHHHQPQQQQQQQQQHFSRFPPAMQQHLQQQQLQQQQHQQHPSQDASLGSRNTSGGAYSIGNAGAADKSGSRGSSLGNMVVSNFFPQSIIDNLQSNGSSASSSSYPGGGNPQAFLSRSGAPPYSNVYSNQASPLHKRKDHDGVDNNPAKRQHFSLR